MSVAVKERPKAKAKRKREPEVRYVWKDGSRFPVSAQVAGDELSRLASESGDDVDNIKPARVVEESRPDEAPLHPCFEWDDETAAERYREDQARSLIRCVRVVEVSGDEEKQQICYVAVTTPEAGNCYVPMSQVMSDDDLRRQALRSAVSLLRGVQERYGHLSELAEVCAAISRVQIPA